MPDKFSDIRESLPGEVSLLLFCIRRLLDLSAPDEPSVNGEINWPRFIELAGTHRVVGPVLAGILSAQIPNIPDSELAELKAQHNSSTLRSLLLTGKLIEILDLFRSRGIRAIAFKGPVLSQDAYGDPAVRAAGDLDLLIHRPHMLAARNLLIARGFRPIFPTSTPAEAEYLSSLTGSRLQRYVNSHSEHHLLHPDGRINVDLHSDITLRQFAMPLDLARMWSNSRQVRLADQSVAALSLEDSLLVLCINASKDCWLRFDRVCDVAALVHRHPEIDFDTLLKSARKSGSQRMTLVTLLLAKEFLNLLLPETISRAVTTDGVCIPLAARIGAEMFAAYRLADDQPTRLDEAIMQLRARDQLHSRLRYLICQSQPTVGDWSALPLPQPLEFLHYFFRPCRLLWNFAVRAR